MHPCTRIELDSRSHRRRYEPRTYCPPKQNTLPKHGSADSTPPNKRRKVLSCGNRPRQSHEDHPPRRFLLPRNI